MSQIKTCNEQFCWNKEPALVTLLINASQIHLSRFALGWRFAPQNFCMCSLRLIGTYKLTNYTFHLYYKHLPNFRQAEISLIHPKIKTLKNFTKTSEMFNTKTWAYQRTSTILPNFPKFYISWTWRNFAEISQILNTSQLNQCIPNTNITKFHWNLKNFLHCIISDTTNNLNHLNLCIFSLISHNK